jgi:hypothetical protein
MPYKSIHSRDLFRDQIVILTGGGRDQPVRSRAQTNGEGQQVGSFELRGERVVSPCCCRR